MTAEGKRSSWLDGLLLLIPLYLLCHDLTAFGLLNNVEGIYAEIAREALAGGHWVIPYLNDVPYIEKPPLMYWLLALSLQIFGYHDWAVRLVPVTAGIVTLGMVGWFGWRVRSARCGVFAAFILGSSVGFVMMSRIAYIDTVLSLLLNAALLLTYYGLVYSNGKRHLRFAALCLALAILAKGLVALVLFGLIGITWLVCYRRHVWRATLQQLFDPWAIAILILVPLPWHIAAAIELPQFPWFYFVNEHLYRFLGIREPHDYYTGTVFYYLPRLLVMAMPWVLCLLLLPRLRRHEPTEQRELRGFFWCCVLVPLIFFSLSSAKANYYALVCLPTLALIAATTLDAWMQKAPQARTLVPIAFLLVGVSWMAVEEYALRYARENEIKYSARPMAQEIQRRVAGGEAWEVYIYQDYENLSSLSFYLRDSIDIVDPHSQDLLFGERLGMGREEFATIDQVMGCGRPPIWLVVSQPRQRAFMATPLAQAAQLVADQGRVALYRMSAHAACGAPKT